MITAFLKGTMRSLLWPWPLIPSTTKHAIPCRSLSDPNPRASHVHGPGLRPGAYLGLPPQPQEKDAPLLVIPEGGHGRGQFGMPESARGSTNISFLIYLRNHR
jgi:hypothetical protein